MLSKKEKERRAQKLRALPIFTNIVRSQRPSIKNLEKLIRINERLNPPILNSYETDALQLKRQALSKAPNAIEKTMTVEQLCEINNPLWALNISISDISFYFLGKECGLSNLKALKKCQTSFAIEPPTTSKIMLLNRLIETYTND